MSKELKNQLIQQRKFYENILSGMKDWVRVIDKDNKVVFMNEPMRKYVGDTVGRECFRALGKTSPCEHCISNRAIFEGTAITKEEVVDGRIYSVVSSPIQSGDNSVRYAVEVFRDVTEKKAMERLLIEQNRKMKSDLDFAKQLQHKILPENRVYNYTMKIASKYIPSEILGGDVYDVIEINDHDIGMYMADVSGHGVTSSMMTMFIRQTLKNLGEKAIDPALTLQYLYHRYRELNIDDQYYITIFYGVYNKNTKLFTYANAGHNCMPILLKEDTVEEIYIEGLPICTIFEDVEYDKNQIALEKGNKLLFYTDGISESYHHEKGFFQTQGVFQICLENKDKEIETLIDMVIHQARDYATEEIKDDIAIMVGEIL
ncbi:sigma-B regulation protein RsbU (phosphoserine phosphatase) [Anaerosolibacter carboniphilus]|uniref:Sigma-B regulation protein RsbU (Phosphoserine phosphatase) n=1 Tax=Anaerosolibacter carboniphilus TaxID=1417629 RepID=A0A841KXQ4_9FIRM|nr:PP2C family protein-serine/threonine phosphatase [Anaerosolibacter carboniphilus]MBB6218526.1 sigma-B regulation protein RsbU (phosphoserine phosphatase) [Anaerosolibacter carboniphilus]